MANYNYNDPNSKGYKHDLKLFEKVKKVITQSATDGAVTLTPEVYENYFSKIAKTNYSRRDLVVMGHMLDHIITEALSASSKVSQMKN